MPDGAVPPQLQASGGLEGHRGSITALVFARKDGMDWLLSGSEDGKPPVLQNRCAHSLMFDFPPSYVLAAFFTIVVFAATAFVLLLPHLARVLLLPSILTVPFCL